MNYIPHGMDTDGPTGEGPVLPTPTILDAPRVKPSVEPDTAGDWLCAWCLNPVANERDRFRINGGDEFSFRNPEGTQFEILTFSHAPGCRETGLPTLEHTWFAGHAWSYCLCRRCQQHLGWQYAGEHTFVGLIRARLVRALHLNN